MRPDSAPSQNLPLVLLKLSCNTDAIQLAAVHDNSLTAFDDALPRLKSLAEEGIIQLSSEIIAINDRQRVLLAAMAVRQGADLKVACSLLSWQNFEAIVEYALRLNGFQTVKHLRVTYGRRWYETDILAIAGKLLVAVDCKRWKTRLTRSLVKQATETQIRRVQAMATRENIAKAEAALRAQIRGTRILPLIVTLTDTPYKVYRGVPIVPILKFRSFLDELYGYLDSLTTIAIG